MVGLALSVLLATQAPASSCAVSDDSAFATTKERAAQVGGGAVYAAARERRYLDALKGPAGQPVTYKRRGSLPLDREGRTILDEYEVSYPGLAKPATIFLDAYHFDDALVAPRGFICAVTFGLAPPGPDPFLAMDALRDLAIEQGASKDLGPISLDADGSAAHGILLDGFRVVARAARAAAAGGARLDASNPPRELRQTRMIVVAYPARCGDKPAVAPLNVDLAPSQGAAPGRASEPVSGDALARLLPAMPLPAGALAVVYPLDRPGPNDTVRITYPEPCGDTVLRFAYRNGRAVNMPPAVLPAGHLPSPRPVRLQAVVDLDGAVQRATYSGGPVDLAMAALSAVRGWTVEPMRLNGSPMATAVVLTVRFR